MQRGAAQAGKKGAAQAGKKGAKRAAKKEAKEGICKLGANAKKMTDRQIRKMFGDKNWHKSKAKERLLKRYRKELKGSTNADLFVDKKTGKVFLKGNKSGPIVKTDLIFE